MKKIVIFQKIIKRSDLVHNLDRAVYLFGDNMKGIGYGGQAGEMRGEPNAIGIPTLWEPGIFFVDSDYDKVIGTISRRFHTALTARQPIIVIPEDGLGTGLAQLDIKAPKIFDKIVECINSLT